MSRNESDHLWAQPDRAIGRRANGHFAAILEDEIRKTQKSPQLLKRPGLFARPRFIRFRIDGLILVLIVLCLGAVAFATAPHSA